MTHIPTPDIPQVDIVYVPRKATPATITVYPLAENKRPIGFAPWPKPKRVRRPKQEKPQ